MSDKRRCDSCRYWDWIGDNWGDCAAIKLESGDYMAEIVIIPDDSTDVQAAYLQTHRTFHCAKWQDTQPPAEESEA